MAKHRPNVPPATKAALRAQAGGKCANPGCPVARTHLHHIREWAVYESHDDEHMIAVCPTCHDAIHLGELPVDDQTLYRWKSITRTDAARRGHLYVEPSREAKLLLGSISVTGDAGLVVFELSERNRLSFALQDGEIVLLSLTVTDVRGREVVRLVDGHVKVAADSGVEYEHVPGHHRITAPHKPLYLPRWVLSRVRGNEPGFDPSDGVVLLDLEVIAPGIVKVEGVWIEGRKGHGVVVTAAGLHFVLRDPTQLRSLNFVGERLGTTLHYTGPITSALFGFGGAPASLDVGGSSPARPRPPSAIHRW